MLKDNLVGWNIILASASPRRHQFFKELEIPFKVRLKSVEEVFPATLRAEEISNFLAELKARPFANALQDNEILVTSDTVVWHKGKSLAKATDKKEAHQMLRTLSGDWHEVITSVSFTMKNKQQTVHHSTKVKFAALSDAEIEFYINKFEPFDKAGAYGIQEWIGLVAIEEINGSYTNVVGLPTHLVYKTLTELTS